MPDGASDTHDLTVPYQEVSVGSDAVAVGDFYWWWHVDGESHSTIYYAEGPCPGCGATVQGAGMDEDAPIDAQGGRPPKVRESAATEDFQVVLHCTCGRNHGREGATGCGRSWVIQGRRRPV